MSSPEESHPGLRPVAPARRATDRFLVVGFAGVALMGYIQSIATVVIPEPSRPYHVFLAVALAAASTLPAIAAAGIARLLHAQRLRRKEADRRRKPPWRREVQ